MSNNVAAVWGSPGSGKTATAIKIAKTLADKKKNIVVVGCDVEAPIIPQLLPSKTETASIGDLLSLTNLSEMTVLQHCIPFGKNEYIALLGYGLGENIRSYPEYDLQKANELISLLKRIADFVIIDCTSHLTDDLLTAAALQNADVTFKVVNADLKSISYIKSQSPLLQNSCFRYSSQINIVNNVLPSQDSCPVCEFLGETYILPNVPDLKEQYDSGNLLDTVFGANAKDYVMTMKTLVKEVFDNHAESEHGAIQHG